MRFIFPSNIIDISPILLTNVNGTESSAKAGSQINVAVQGAAVNDAGLIGTVGISGSIKADGDVRVDVKSEKGIGLRANSVGDHSEYTGEVIVKTNNGTAVGAVAYSGSYDAVTHCPFCGSTVITDNDAE